MREIRSFLSSRYPHLYRAVKNMWYGMLSSLTGIPKHQRLFEKMYNINHWGNIESRSGPGSNLVNSSIIRRELPKLISELKAKSILDIPCGDFYWMKLVDLHETKYIGADIVRPMIEQHIRLFPSEYRRFVVCDLLNDPLPIADVVLCRDCLPHLSFSDIQKAFYNIRRSGTSYLITSTYPDRSENTDIETGRFRPLNLMAPPFNFPPPVKLINEGYSDSHNNCGDKSIAVWKISDLMEIYF